MVANRKRLVVSEAKKQAKAVNSKVKTGNKPEPKDFGLKLSSRLFSIPQKSRILLVSSSHSEQKAPEIISKVVERAELDGCQVVIHAGSSFRIAGRESLESILNTIAERIRGTRVCRYLAEIYNDKKTSDPPYYIIFQDPEKISKCLEQKIVRSLDKVKIVYFADALGKIPYPRKTAMPNEYPCLLLACGENNLFNKGNRGGGDVIKDKSLSDGVLTSLKRIQGKQWCVVNPSHNSYPGIIGNYVMNYHKALSKDDRVKCVFAVNNPARTAGKNSSQANLPTLWRNGKPKSGRLVYDDQGLYMYRFDLDF